MRKILNIVDLVNEQAGSISGWLVAALITVILYEVISRYVFSAPTPWAFGTFRMLGGAIVVMGWAYAQRHNSHIRVDVFYVYFSPRKKALIDVVGTGLFFFPLFTAFIVLAGSSVRNSLLRATTVGYQLAPLLYQTIVVIGLCLFFLQFAAQFVRNIYILTRGHYD